VEELSIEVLAVAVHFGLALITVLLVLVADIVEREQKNAQLWICLLVPFVGSLFIAFFTVHEKLYEAKYKKTSLNNTATSDEHGIDLHIAQKQHERSTGSEGSD